MTIPFELVYFYYAYRIVHEVDNGVIALSPDCKSADGTIPCDFDSYVSYIITADQKSYYKSGGLGGQPQPRDAAEYIIVQRALGSTEIQIPVHDIPGNFTGVYNPSRVCTFNENKSKVPWINLIRQVAVQIQSARVAAAKAGSPVSQTVDLYTIFAQEAIQYMYQAARAERSPDMIAAFKKQFPTIDLYTAVGSSEFTSDYDYIDSYTTLFTGPSLYDDPANQTFNNIITWAKSYSKNTLQNLEVLQQTYQQLKGQPTCL